MNIYIVYKNMTVGGAELLMVRLAQKLIQNNHMKIFSMEIDPLIQRKFENIGVEIHLSSNWSSCESILGLGQDDEKIVVLTFLWGDYIKIKGTKKENITTLFYAVHYRALAIGRGQNDIKGWLVKVLGKSIIKDGIRSGNIFVMDEQTTDYTNSFYHMQEKPEIVRIAMDITDEFSTEKKVPLNILSIARAEFPFKGYLLGLVDLFVELKIVHPNLTLTIVSYGDDIERLKDKIDSVPQNVRKDILLLGKTDYDGLVHYYQKATVYVGMGTTILDAAQRGIPSFAVAAYRNNVCISTRFDQNPYYIAVDEKKQPIGNAKKLIDDILCADSRIYLKIARESRNQVLKNYSSDVAVQSLIRIAENAKPNSPKVGEILWKKFYQVKSIL